MSKTLANTVRHGLLAHHADAAGAVAQCTQSSNMICMGVGIHTDFELQIELLEQAEIVVGIGDYRVDQQCFTAVQISKQVGVSGRVAIK